MIEIKRHTPIAKSAYSVLLALVLSVLSAAGVSYAGNSTPRLPPQIANAPDLQVFVLSGPSGQDTLNITYGLAVSLPQVRADLSSLSQTLTLDLANVKVSNSALPITGMQTPIMTSITVPAPGAAPLDGQSLPVASLIVALQRYHRLEITYIMPPGYSYNGITRYADKNVALQSVSNGSTCVFNVVINSVGRFALTLPQPVSPQDEDHERLLEERQLLAKQKRLQVIELFVIVVFAVLVGIIIYAAAKNLQTRAK